MNNSLISKYIPLNTIIHNLDPRAKIFFVIWYLVDVFISYNVLEFLILILMILAIVILSKTSPAFLINSVKAISILILFTSLIHLVFNKKGDVLYGMFIIGGESNEFKIMCIPNVTPRTEHEIETGKNVEIKDTSKDGEKNPAEKENE